MELAQRIIGMALKSNLVAGRHLYEQTLADEFSVSRTPVRKALKLLEEQGVVEKRDAGGYSLALDPESLTDLITTLPEGPEAAVYKEILRDRSAHRLEDTVTAAALMRRYNCSRQIIRNVLNLLSEDQLIERALGQSWIFRPSLDDHNAVMESYRFRMKMEPAALLEPGYTIDSARFASLRSRMQILLDMADHEFDTDVFFQTDYEFHEVIARGCGNRFFADVLLHHLRLRRIPRTYNHPGIFRLKTSLNEHLEIFDYINAGQFENAADSMRLHLRVSSDQRPNIANRGAPAGIRL